MNFADILWEGARSFADRPALCFEDRTTSWGELADDVRRAAGMLRSAGVARGDRVALYANNAPEWLANLFAIASLGAICVPINPALTSSEACNIVAHCEPKVVIADQPLVPLLEPVERTTRIIAMGSPAAGEWRLLVAQAVPHGAVEDMEPAEPAIIFYTSGTTGQPKGVVLGHSAVTFIADMCSRHSMTSPADISLVMGSVAFIYPLVINALASLRGGATVVLQGRFHPESAARVVQERRVTVIMGVPTMYTMIANWAEGRPHDFSSIRLAYSAGAAFPASLAERVGRTLGFNVFDMWGMTECTPVTSFDPARDTAGVPDSAGRALPGCAFRVVDDALREVATGEVGEIMLTSPGLMTEYFRNPAATREVLIDGWVRSGDLGRVDDQGCLYIVGRKKDLIIRGGANISPVDVEEALFAHSAVAECAVVGVPDNLFGELVTAYVVRKPGATIDEAALTAHCRSLLAEYKVPSSVLFVDSLPKGPTGKILRRVLRDRAGSGS